LPPPTSFTITSGWQACPRCRSGSAPRSPSRAHPHPHGGGTTGPPTDTQQRFGKDVAQAAAQRYRAGDPAGAVDAFFRGVFGPGYRPALDHGMPGAFDQAVADADAFFTQEMPALRQWPFTEDDAHRIQQPTLAVLGTASPPIFAERQKLLLQWLPNAEPLDLPGLTHLLHGQNPSAVAEGLAGFYARHPLPEDPSPAARPKQQNNLLCAASAVTSQGPRSVHNGGDARLI
jgi:pimeloyl-ACP methyl ester carboxylesterase